MYVPYAALLGLLLSYFYVAIGFTWRYAFDFWPLVVLVVVQYVAGSSPSLRRHAFGWRMTLAFDLHGGLGVSRHVLPERWTIDMVRPGSEEELGMADSFARWGERRR